MRSLLRSIGIANALGRLVFIASLGACGLSVDGIAPVGGGDAASGPGDAGRPTADGAPHPEDATSFADAAPPADAASPVDAKKEEDAPAAPVDAACTHSTCPATPAGFTPVAFEDSRAAPCPAGFDTADALENPAATAATCTCGGCTPSGGPDCQQGSITTTYDNGGPGGGSCQTAGVTISANGGMCQGQGGTLGQNAAMFAPPPAVMPSCSAKASPNAGAVTATEVRVCAVSAGGCPADACDPALAPTFATCLASAGDVSCPAGFPTKHVVAASVDVTCGACSCKATATCHGTVTFYQSGGCGGNAVATVNGDGTCTSTRGVAFGSYEWAGAAAVQCDPGASTGSASLHGPETICCP